MSALVLALNPSIDAEWRVDDVLWEEKNNVRSERRWAGGKGINVARWLGCLGTEAQLLLPLGGTTGDELAGYLQGERISARVVRLHEPTRVNIIVTTDAGRQMRFNPPGPRLAALHWGRIVRQTEALLRRSSLLILSGSLPCGLANDSYRVLLKLAHRLGVQTLLDCEGAALRTAVPARPFLVKPNEHELAGWWDKPLRSEAEVARAAKALSDATGGWVLVSRGAKRSLLVNVTEGRSVSASPRRVTARNTVGAGDALLAAVAHQILRGAPPARWLAAGLAAGTAATQLLPGNLPARRLRAAQ